MEGKAITSIYAMKMHSLGVLVSHGFLFVPARQSDLLTDRRGGKGGKRRRCLSHDK